MKAAGLDLQFINGKFGDPAVYGFHAKTGAAILFDAGNLERMPQRDLLRVEVVCVSHAHIDHFCGFDRLIRINIPHFRTVHVCGPAGIAANVSGKLSGYLWNLLEPGQMKFHVHELTRGGGATRYLLSNDNGFQPVIIEEDLGHVPGQHIIHVRGLPCGFDLSATILDHGTDVVAYRYQDSSKLHVIPESLKKLSLTPGPWISQLQRWTDTGEKELSTIRIEGKDWQSKDLAAAIFSHVNGESVGYATDLAFSRQNIDRLSEVMASVSLFICESSFRDVDFQRARSKKHLTSRQAAILAALCEADQLETFHYSNIYAKDSVSEIEAEARSFFAELSDQTTEIKDLKVQEELLRQPSSNAK